MLKKSSFSSQVFLLLWLAIWPLSFVHGDYQGFGDEGVLASSGPMIKREQRKAVVSTEYGQISAARVTDNLGGSYLLHFFTLEPNSLLLPVILHADMVFYVHTGSGRLSWTDEDELKAAELRRGDVYRLQEGSVFFIQSNLETDQTERQKLRIHAFFANPNADLYEPATLPYSSIRDMVLGFHRDVLQAAFKVSEEVVEELMNGTKPPAIVHRIPETKKTAWEMEAQFIRGLLGGKGRNIFELNKKKKRESAKLYNLFTEDRDFENCNGWSTTVTRKKLSALKGSNIGLFMVNLTYGSMMGPHWNPVASEIGIVLQGRGMVRVVCPSISNETLCRNMRFEVEEGDVFAAPRFHPMAQMAFNNETFVFMGFSTSAKKNHPQYLAGKASVLRTLDKDVLAMSFNVTNTTMDALLTPQDESVILGCVSCAETELRVMEEEMEKEREAAREREEEEARKRQEEKTREEEEARRREEEAAKKEEEKRKKREEEEEEEERKRQEEEEAARKREEEEEEARQREKEEAEAKEREEEEEARRREEEEKEARQREKEEAETKQREEEEKEARRREKEEAEAREKEEARRREQEEAEAREREEEAKEREEEEKEARRREKEEAEAREQEEARRREQEEAEAREREQEEAAAKSRRAEEEAAREREEEKARRREEEQEAGKSEEEQAAEEERRRQEEAEREEEQQGGRGGGGDEGQERETLRKRITV